MRRLPSGDSCAVGVCLAPRLHRFSSGSTDLFKSGGTNTSISTLKIFEVMAYLPATLGAIVLLGSINLSAANKGTCDLYAAVGSSVSLPFAYHRVSDQDILRWTHGKTVIFYRHQGRVRVGKAEDFSANGSLMLRNLQFSSAGTYTATLLHPNGSLANTWTVELCVMNKVSKPKLTYSCDSKSPAVNLVCEIANPQDLVFSWTINGNTLTGEKKQTLSVSVADLRGEGSFMCSVANRVSQEKSDTVRPPCKRPPPSPVVRCYDVKTIAGVLAGAAGVILFLLIVIMILCIKGRKKDGTEPQTGEKLRMLSVSKREPDLPTHEYENMRVSEKPGPSAPPAEGLQPSPVPKPRKKNQQTPNY